MVLWAASTTTYVAPINLARAKFRTTFRSLALAGKGVAASEASTAPSAASADSAVVI